MLPAELYLIREICFYLWAYNKNNLINMDYAYIEGHLTPQQPRRYSPDFSLSPFPFPLRPLILPSIPPTAKWPPWNQLGVLGSAVSSSSGVWGEAPAPTSILVYSGREKTHFTAIITCVFVYWNLLSF